MATLRFKALESALNRQAQKVNYPEGTPSSYFATNVLTQSKMREYLSKEAYESILQAMEKGEKIDRSIANQIASGMKSWAIEKGATHYTHWFHPLNGATAEKHDAFFEPTEDGGAIEAFSGTLLVQQEPDASSFPNGGIRNTFEARGYTAWDPTSPVFILDKTLCIPTVFVSYTGEALDYKTPLLKSLTQLDKHATAVCQYFDKNITKVIANLGWEQEYFLIDEALYYARPDIMLTGRTLMGHASAKDQQLEDHYFGAIPERVAAYMKDFEIEALKLGIPVKTRHNEVAPNQFECAPIYEEVNLAVDHNQLLSEIMNKVAIRHHFKVLMHEKPYKGINGSGKHNNWSMATNTGKNLLSPGKTPKGNLQFLTFIINTVMAVHKYADLLRASIVSPGNEHRLGASEAPPSIISIFLGKHLTSLLDEIENRVPNVKMSQDEKAELKLDIGKIPEILLDNTDRNRTSPFAFTGNRFEFRAVGSTANCASPMIVLNTIVTKQLKDFKQEVDANIKQGIKKDEAIFKVLKSYIKQSRNILFEGNGYSDEWITEAEKRGLSNIKDMVEAIEYFVDEDAVRLFEELNVLNRVELQARLNIRREIFIKKIQIESRTLGDLALNHIIPTSIKYQNILIQNLQGINNLGIKTRTSSQEKTIIAISEHISFIETKVAEMIEARKKANNIAAIADKAKTYNNNVKPFLELIRYHIDKLELIVDDEMWSLPKYRELLFVR
jgi:glutamine synthetase